MIIVEPAFLPAGMAAKLVKRLESLKLSPGHLTAGPAGKGLKNNMQLGPSREATEMSAEIEGVFQRSPRIVQQAAVRQSVPFMFNCYREGMEYKAHVDNPYMHANGVWIRADLSATLFLSEPDSYDGGELVINANSDPTLMKLPAGGIVIYPGNGFHRVNPVTRGVRWAAVTWIQSSFRELERRRLNRDLLVAMDLLSTTADIKDHPAVREAFDNVNRARNEYLRLWGE